jgi:hypothetical protein
VGGHSKIYGVLEINEKEVSGPSRTIRARVATGGMRINLVSRRRHAWRPRFKVGFRGKSLRITDRRFWPRRWWYPPQTQLLFADDADRRRYHDETSRTLRRSVSTLVVFAFFCVLTLGTTDTQVLSANSRIRIPFANVEIAFSAFLIVGPVVLIGLTIYQHIFLAHLASTDPPPIHQRIPALFNLPYASAQVISAALFYWLAPAVLVIFARKALPRPEGKWLALVALACTAATIFVIIRRTPGDRRGTRNPAAWFSLFLVVLVFSDKTAVIAAGRPLTDSLIVAENSRLAQVYAAPFHRKVNLSAADLRAQDLSGFNLAGANLRNADLRQTNLDRAVLDGADLRGANMSGATLRNASLIGVRRK